MKKIVVFTLALMAVSATAFAASDLASGGISTDGVGLYGGVDSAAANAAPNPLVKFSSKVNGIPVFTTAAYALATKHQTGNKVFGTSNDATQIYWKQTTAGKITTDMASGADLTATKFVGNGWTAY